ncbi:MAG: TerC family protein [Bdellovibrionales bacterium]|nr:TerC family protein [Bdellovibrionales bacterium]
MSLTVLEIILGIDNLVFITILAGRVPKAQQARTRRIGLLTAVVTRILFLMTASYLMNLKEPLFTVMDHAFSVHDLVLLAGGLFLLLKTTLEVYRTVEIESKHQHADDFVPKASNMGAILVQIAVIDTVFSIDSVITAVGMAQHLSVMVAAILIGTATMVAFAGPVGDFIQANASLKVLALSFLMLLGVMLVAEGFGEHFNRGYIYFGMGFSFFVELLNLRARRNSVRRRAAAR